MLAVGGLNLADALAIGDEELQDPFRDGVQVAQVDDGFRHVQRWGCGREEVPAIYETAADLISNQRLLEDSAVDQLPGGVDEADQDARRLLLRQVTRLRQDDDADTPTQRLGLQAVRGVMPEDGTAVDDVPLRDRLGRRGQFIHGRRSRLLRAVRIW